MEATYKRAAAGKRRMQRTDEERAGDKRRLIQLLVSLGLFLLVFIGRGVFPGMTASLGNIVTTDADFKAAFQRFGQDIANDESVWSAVGRLVAASFGGEVEDPLEPEPAVTPAEQETVAVTLLSETKMHGLAYLRENGLREYNREPTAEPVDAEPEPEIVTAVAQAYTADGIALPSNVSYEYYELGLEKTAVPVMGTVTSGFEYRTSPITGSREFHLALDIAATEGTEIGAFADGVVRYIGESDEFGLYLMIDHDNGVATFYAHCSELLVHKGDVVTCGQTVALVGHTGNATGAHLHFTIEKDDIRLDPAHYVDPS